MLQRIHCTALVLEHAIKFFNFSKLLNLISRMDIKTKRQLNTCLPSEDTIISDSYLITLSNSQISCLFKHYYNAHQDTTFTEVCIKASTSYCSKEVVRSIPKKVYYLQIWIATESSSVIITTYRSTCA